MKYWIRKLFYQLIYIRFTYIFYRKRCKSYVICDIDNTLADSWISFHCEEFKDENQRLSSLAIFLGMLDLLKFVQKNKHVSIIFLSARSMKFYPTTVNWIKGNTLIASFSNVFLVQKPMDKLKYLKFFIDRKKHVLFIDDLTYNHELGKIEYYSSVVNKLSDMELTYWGVDEINQINNENEKIFKARSFIDSFASKG